MNKMDRSLSLEGFLGGKQDIVDYFFNDTISPWHEARMGLLARFIPPEVTNWRDEQRAWRNTAMLFDLSHHMPGLYLRGPDAIKLLDRLAINGFMNFAPGRAKQFIACSPYGHMIGDCIAYCHAPDDIELVSGMFVLNWVEYNARAGGYDVSIERETPTPFMASGRRNKYRFQLEGPNAAKIFDKLVDGGAPEIPFFRTAKVKIRGLDVLVLRHGMAGHMGAELSGPYDEMAAFVSAVREVGQEYGMLEGGTKSYFSATMESGWIPYPVPGIYTGEKLKDYRGWLAADCWEAKLMLGGSYRAGKIEDYYVNPWDMGYGHLVKLDRDFVGRDALAEMADKPQRTKVTLVWNHDDLEKLFGSQFGGKPRVKALELPVSYYGYPHHDEVVGPGGELIGLSTHCGYSINEGEMLSLTIIDREYAEPGTQVSLVWGEPNGGSRKAHVEHPHAQMKIRATVEPAPYAQAARQKRALTK